jgi:signal peptide peptidase SppA
MNKFAFYVAEQLYGKPWLIDSGTFHRMHEIAQAHINAEQFPREGTGACGEAVELEGMSIENGVARIPIAGTVISGRDLPVEGLVHTKQIAKEIDEAESRADVGRIEFHIDSPGGMVQGTPELADRIFAINKPTAAIVEGQASSAGYWLASAADTIIASQTAQVGSIGVFVAIPDVSMMYERAGVKMEVIKSGDLKAAGMPGTTLSAEQRAHFQEGINAIHDKFVSHVRDMRGDDVPDEAFRGQSFMAEKALKFGLVDYVV